MPCLVTYSFASDSLMNPNRTVQGTWMGKSAPSCLLDVVSRLMSFRHGSKFDPNPSRSRFPRCLPQPGSRPFVTSLIDALIFGVQGGGGPSGLQVETFHQGNVVPSRRTGEQRGD